MKHFPGWSHRLTLLLTLRWRLTFWIVGLTLVLGCSLVVFINRMAGIQIPQVFEVQLVPTAQPVSGDSTLLPTPLPDASRSVIEAPGPQTAAVQEMVIREVRTISLIGIAAFALAGAIGAYWIARQSLQPLRRLSRLARDVQAQTLHQRLPAEGPPDELKELADAFNLMLERLEQAFEQQNRFVADAAHELRTPLTILRTNLEVLQQDPAATLSDYQETAPVLGRTVSRLERLVADLLLLAQGEEHRRAEPVEPEVLLTEIIEELAPLARAHQTRLRLGSMDQGVVRADPSLLHRAISNIIENGIRYNRPGGAVVVTVRRTPGGIEVRVDDTGVGIPAEAQPRIFERFYRVDQARARSQGGSGLGLAIAAHIVQLHGGYIRLQSTPGAGSTFTIGLPADGREASDLELNRGLTPPALS